MHTFDTLDSPPPVDKEKEMSESTKTYYLEDRIHILNQYVQFCIPILTDLKRSIKKFNQINSIFEFDTGDNVSILDDLEFSKEISHHERQRAPTPEGRHQAFTPAFQSTVMSKALTQKKQGRKEAAFMKDKEIVKVHN